MHKLLVESGLQKIMRSKCWISSGLEYSWWTSSVIFWNVSHSGSTVPQEWESDWHSYFLTDLSTSTPQCILFSSSVSIQNSHSAPYSESCESRQGIINLFFTEDNGGRANMHSTWPWVIFFPVIFKDDAQRVNMAHNWGLIMILQWECCIRRKS